MKRAMRCLIFTLVLLVMFPVLNAYASVVEPDPTHHLDWALDWGEEFRVGAITFSCGTVVHPSENYVFLMIDGVLIPDAEAVVQSGRTLVPLRVISESFGAEVSWDASTSQVTVEKGESTIAMTIGSSRASVNGNAISLDVPATLIGGRTYVPLRLIADSMGANVGFYNDSPFSLIPVVWVDSEDIINQQALSLEDALEKTKARYRAGLNIIRNSYIAEHGADVGLGEHFYLVRDQIDGMSFVGEFSRYLLFSAGRGIVDKITGEVFGFKGSEGDGFEVFPFNNESNLDNSVYFLLFTGE